MSPLSFFSVADPVHQKWCQFALWTTYFSSVMWNYSFYCPWFLAPAKEEKEAAPEKTSEKPASATPVKGNKKAPITKAAKVSLRDKKLSHHSSSKKPVTPHNKTSSKTKKLASSTAKPQSSYPPGPIHITGALRVTKSNFTIPKKQPQQKDASSESHSSSRVPSSQAFSASSSHSSSRSHSASSAPPASPVPPPPNNQMRQNIRRSLTDILYKRWESHKTNKPFWKMLFFFPPCSVLNVCYDQGERQWWSENDWERGGKTGLRHWKGNVQPLPQHGQQVQK